MLFVTDYNNWQINYQFQWQSQPCLFGNFPQTVRINITLWMNFNFQVPWVPYDEFVVLAAESTESLKRLFLFMTNYVVNNGHKQMNPNRANLTNCTYMSKCVNWKNYYLNKITSILMTFEVYWETIGRSNSFDKYLFCSKWTIWRLNC